jgi:hypothetical protein
MGHNTPARITAAQRTWQSRHDDQFVYALVFARSSRCGDARDKVYSQLGLGGADITPDYHATIAGVYITTAEYILNHSKSLLLLTCVEGKECQEVPGLPSWVPDWSVRKDIGLRGISGLIAYNAADHLPKRHVLSIHDDGTRILAVKGAELDYILDIGEPKKDIRNKLHRSHLWEMISNLGAMYEPVPGQSREEAIWRSFLTNRQEPTTSLRSIETKYPASSERFEPSFRAWLLWRYAAGSDEPTIFPESISSSHLIPTEAEFREAHTKSKQDPAHLAELKHQASLYDVHYLHAPHLRPFVTKNGYFGVGTQCLRRDDTIWIVPGCPIPLILRRIEKSAHYQLVGSSYVHGFMNGEILQRQDLEFSMVSLR